MFIALDWSLPNVSVQLKENAQVGWVSGRHRVCAELLEGRGC